MVAGRRSELSSRKKGDLDHDCQRLNPSSVNHGGVGDRRKESEIADSEALSEDESSMSGM